MNVISVPGLMTERRVPISTEPSRAAGTGYSDISTCPVSTIWAIRPPISPMRASRSTVRSKGLPSRRAHRGVCSIDGAADELERLRQHVLWRTRQVAFHRGPALIPDPRQATEHGLEI